ncbi:MAG: diaminopimelate decarboxylase [Chloroflexaceae bacterium]|nr:diaminopimelate decarboxylase [Chloroflexaceae bacterium]
MVSTQIPKLDCGLQYLPASPDLAPNQILLPLTAAVNAQDGLDIGGCEVTTLVQQYGSPLYILDETTLRAACRHYRDAFIQYYPGPSQVLYASKAWSCLAVCAIAASEGLGFDVVSGGELVTAIRALEELGRPHPGPLIYFHGNNKAKSELELALAQGCTVVVDNWLELTTLADLAAQQGTVAPILLRFTPGIDCHTHEYIRTGHLDNKFGFDPNQLDPVFSFVSQQPQLNCLGLHAHNGSQIFELQPHRDLAATLIEWLGKAAHYGLSLGQLNIGGGLGIRYVASDDPPAIADWVKAVAQAVVAACQSQNLPLPKLLAEPGRSLIGSACVTAYTIGSRKSVPEIRTYLAVDGGMSDNPRPITYQAAYQAVVANRLSAPMAETVTIAGKHCESGDILIKDARLPHTEPGDILVVLGTGAYNYSMSSNYNRLTRPAAIAVREGEANLILERETYEDLLRQDRLPERLLAQP